MSIQSLMEQFSELEDPPMVGKVDHRRIDILVIAVCAVIACAESWDDIALYGRSKEDWLRRFLDLPNGIPSHDTFRRVFMLIDPYLTPPSERQYIRYAHVICCTYEFVPIGINADLKDCNCEDVSAHRAERRGRQNHYRC